MPTPPKKEIVWERLEQRIQILDRSENLLNKKQGSFINLNWSILNPKFIFAPMLSLVLLLIIFYDNSNIEISTYAGEKKTISLLDGSKIYLNSVSSISYDEKFNIEHRNIKLYGEAYFEIAKGTLPFIVESKYANVEVLGTAFNIKNRPEGYELGVNEGRVKLKSKSKSQELKKGECIQISKTRNQILNQTYSEYPSWRYDKIHCDNRSLAQVCLELERIFDVVIKISRPELQTLTVSGIINAKNLNDALNALSLLSPCEVKFDGDKYTIS